MEKLPNLPRRVDVERALPLALKLMVKGIVGVEVPTTVTVSGVNGEEVIASGVASKYNGFEFADRSKGDMQINSREGYVRMTVKDINSGEAIAVAHVAVKEWLEHENGLFAVPLVTATESSKDDASQSNTGPSYYNTFRDCKTDAQPSKGGYLVVRFQFSKPKESAVVTASEKDQGVKHKDPVSEKAAEVEVLTSPVASRGPTIAGGNDAVIVRLRLAACSGVLTRPGETNSVFLEVYAPRPEGAKKKSTAPRITGGHDEKESHSILNSKGLLATRTAIATIGENAKGEVKYSWDASDAKSTAQMLLDGTHDAGAKVRIHAYTHTSDPANFLGEASIAVADLIVPRPGSLKLKFEPRENETDERILQSVGKLGQLLAYATVLSNCKDTSLTFIPAAGQFTHLRVQVVRCEGLVFDPPRTVHVIMTTAKGVVCTLPPIQSSNYPLWGGDGSQCLIPIGEVGEGVGIAVRSGGLVLNKARLVPCGPAGCVQLPLGDAKGDAPSEGSSLGTVSVLWSFDTLKKDEGPTEDKVKQSPSVPVAPAFPNPGRSPTPTSAQPVFETFEDASPPKPQTSMPQSAPIASRTSSVRPIAADSVVVVAPLVAAVTQPQDPAGLVAEFLKEVRPLSKEGQFGVVPKSSTSSAPPPNVYEQLLMRREESPPTSSGTPKRVPVTVPALIKIRGVDMDMLQSVPRPNQIRFLQSVLRDIAGHLLLDPIQLSIVSVAAGMLIDFKFQLTDDQARRNIMDAFVQKTLAGTLTLRHANAAFVEYLGGVPSTDPRFPNIVAETAATFGEFRTAEPPRMQIASSSPPSINSSSVRARESQEDGRKNTSHGMAPAASSLYYHGQNGTAAVNNSSPFAAHATPSYSTPSQGYAPRVASPYQYRDDHLFLASSVRAVNPHIQAPSHTYSSSPPNRSSPPAGQYFVAPNQQYAARRGDGGPNSPQGHSEYYSRHAQRAPSPHQQYPASREPVTAGFNSQPPYGAVNGLANSPYPQSPHHTRSAYPMGGYSNQY